MAPPAAEPPTDPALAELRALVETLLAEVTQLRAENEALKAENQALKDEIARLKGLPPRPTFKPSGMEKATQPPPKQRLKRGRSAKRLAVTDEQVIAADVPPGSRFKGYEDVLVQELAWSARVIRYRRERWLTPAGTTVVAPLPAGVIGGFGPGLRRFLLAGHIQGQVTSERLTALVTGLGLSISKRQVVRLLTTHLGSFVAEEQAVLREGLTSARWITVDDTAARHARQDGYTTQLGNDCFTAFRTGPSKSRAAFLATLRAGWSEYRINEAAISYMQRRGLAGPVIATLLAQPQRVFADDAAWHAHLAKLGLDQLKVTPDAVTIATEGALWGTICHHRLLEDTIIVSDDAGQFRVGDHALCWVHAERLVHKLIPANAPQRRAVELVRQLIWWFYADLKAYRRDPCRRRAAALRARFDRIFQRKTGYIMLDRLLARLHRRKHELLRVLDRPEIPLHTNGSENDIRATVTKRKISGGTMSDKGRIARDVLLGLMKTCRKLQVSFVEYLGDRLAVPGTPTIPPLPDLVRHAAAA